MTYLLSPLEEALVESVDEVVRKEAAVVPDDPAASCRPELWDRLAVDLGWAGIALPEAYGGAGASFAELCLVFRALGSQLVGIPLADTAVVALALVDCGPGAAPDAVAALATGARGALVGGPGVTVSGGGEVVLHGRTDAAIGVPEARHLLVQATRDGVPVLVLVDRDEVSGVAVAPVAVADHTRAVGRVEFTAATVPAAAVLAESEAAARLGRRARARRGIALAAEGAGIAHRALELAQEYVADRRQFGRAIGSFQAVKHHLANVLVLAEQAKVASRRASVADPAGPGFVHDAAVATLFCGTAAIRAVEISFQLHGGIAFTSEHPIHLYYRRAQVNAHLGWPLGECRDVLRAEWFETGAA